MHAWYYNWFFPRFARKASRIATVSAYSKTDMVQNYGIAPEKVDVVYNGVNTGFEPVSDAEKESTRRRVAGGQPYFLYVGSLHPRKNIDGLLKAFDLYKSQTGSDFKLVIAGAVMFSSGRIRAVWESMAHRSDVVFTGRLETGELHQVLGAALALTFVPYFEGFGIPVLEGMSVGIPVICSNVTSLPEVGGDAVLYADPFQPLAIAAAMQRVADDENLRNELIRKGYDQLAQFSWERTADLLWDCIHKCLNETD